MGLVLPDILSSLTMRFLLLTLHLILMVKPLSGRAAWEQTRRNHQIDQGGNKDRNAFEDTSENKGEKRTEEAILRENGDTRTCKIVPIFLCSLFPFLHFHEESKTIEEEFTGKTQVDNVDELLKELEVLTKKMQKKEINSNFQISRNLESGGGFSLTRKRNSRHLTMYR